jgi:hypothetical protein
VAKGWLGIRIGQRGGWEKAVRSTDWLSSYLFSSRRAERDHRWLG